MVKIFNKMINNIIDKSKFINQTCHYITDLSEEKYCNNKININDNTDDIKIESDETNDVYDRI